MEKGEKKGEQERKTHDARGRRWMERKRGIEKGEGRRGTTTVQGRRPTIKGLTWRTWASATPGEKLEKKTK